MRSLLVSILLLVLLTSCKSQPPYTDNGNPGQIKAVVFYDDNKNGTFDGGEAGAPVDMGISQEVSCPPSNLDKNTIIKADADGIALIEDLTPGKYCVMPGGNYSMTTKLTQEVYVSSDAVTTVLFGIVRQ
jgi:hypothetical protein